ncbi:hypothetical protein [Jatrophihabitans endophyticus]|uniref:hypothetical protein n=1 Tax=Jatrophihabitans endophyticus TaxID=1206085 RepID=UPI0019DD4445|nr:hypothetical protein [Jatrophihabitans endophyticus]MBE7186775.1 hypothetical protein [Jatrophihabitans endophyticus]
MDVQGAGVPTADATENGASAEADPVAAALRRLDTVADLPLEQRPDAFQAVHDALRSALAEIDDA